jgi:hypothetical protein
MSGQVLLVAVLSIAVHLIARSGVFFKPRILAEMDPEGLERVVFEVASGDVGVGGYLHRLGAAETLNVRLVRVYGSEESHDLSDTMGLAHVHVSALQTLLRPVAAALAVKVVVHEHALAAHSGTKVVATVRRWALDGYAAPALPFTDLDSMTERSVVVALVPADWGWPQDTDYFLDEAAGVVVLKQLDEDVREGAAGVVVGHLRQLLLGLPGQVPSSSTSALTAAERRAVQLSTWRRHTRVAIDALKATWTLHQTQLHLGAHGVTGYTSAYQCVEGVLQEEGEGIGNGEEAVTATAAACARAATALTTDPRLVPDAYLPLEHHLALYGPFWIPLLVPLLQAMKLVCQGATAP